MDDAPAFDCDQNVPALLAAVEDSDVVKVKVFNNYFGVILGMVIGSLISVFAKDAIHGAFGKIRDKKWGVWGIIPASVLGIASPLCMYGTIPIAASFSRNGMRDDWLAAFMMSSILLNPQLIIYSTALGGTALAVRIISCFICGCAAGLLIHIFYKNKPFFNFDGFEPRASHDTNPNPFLRFLFNLGRIQAASR